MRWFQALSKRQKAILIALTILVIGVFGTMGWVVWSTMRGYEQAIPLPTPTNRPSSTARPTFTPTPTRTPTPTPAPTFDVSQAGLVAADVVDVRGLRLRLGVPLSLVSEYELSVVLYQYYEAFPPVTVIEDNLLTVLRLSPTSARLDPVAQAANIAAIYLPEWEELYLRRDWTGSLDEIDMQLAYAYARALSDQTGNLPNIPADTLTQDLELALDAVKDGNAIYTLWRYLELDPSTPEAINVARAIRDLYGPVWRDDPPKYADLNQFSFDLGVEMAQAHVAENGAEAMDVLLDRPPRSTEQLLHVGQYLDDELPVPVTAIAPSLEARSPGAGWTEVRAEIMGEALTGWVFSAWQHVAYDPDQAAGWGGDYLQVWQHEEGDYAAAWHFVWDSGSDAATYYQMLIELMPGRLIPGVIDDTTPAATLPQGRWWSGGQGAVYLRRYAGHVWLIWGSDKDFVAYLGTYL